MSSMNSQNQGLLIVKQQQALSAAKKCKKIIIGNLQSNITVRHLLKHFRFFGHIKDVYIEKYVGDFKTERYGCVVFRDAKAIDSVFRFKKHIILDQTVSITIGHTRIEVLGQLDRLCDYDLGCHFNQFGPVLDISKLTASQYNTIDKKRVVTFYSDEVIFNMSIHVIKGVIVHIKEFTVKLDFAHTVFIEELDANTASTLRRTLPSSYNQSKLPNQVVCDSISKSIKNNCLNKVVPQKLINSCMYNKTNSNNLENFPYVKVPQHLAANPLGNYTPFVYNNLPYANVSNLITNKNFPGYVNTNSQPKLPNYNPRIYNAANASCNFKTYSVPGSNKQNPSVYSNMFNGNSNQRKENFNFNVQGGPHSTKNVRPYRN